MKEIRNTTTRPLRVPLPQGRVLHLNPRGTGQVVAGALEHPPFRKLVEEGKIEVLGDGAPEGRHPFKEQSAGGSRTAGGRPPAGVTHSSGER